MKFKTGTGRLLQDLAGLAASRHSGAALDPESAVCGALPKRRCTVLQPPAWLCLLAVILSGAINHCGAAADAGFAQGLAAGRAGEFNQAAKYFRAALVAQPASGTLLNLGLAHWRDGRPGEAILCWEQSAWLNPFDQDARNNLRFVRTETQVEPPELVWYERSSTWLPANVWAGILCGCLWLAVGMMLLPDVLRVRKARWQQVVAALGLGAFLLSLPPNLGVVTRSRLGIVLDKKAVLRLTPTKQAEVVATLTAGEPVRRVRERGDYVFVRTPRGAGWVERRQLGMTGEIAN